MTETVIRVLKTSTCKSTSGKSTLTYQIGCTPNNVIHIRISKNTGAGFFNDEWIKIEDIQKALAKGRKGDPLTSFLLEHVMKGKSVNTPAFLMAALTHAGLLRVLKGKKRGHEFMDPEGFDARMQRLVTSPKKTKGIPRKTTRTSTKTVGKKAAVKKKATARRKAQNLSS